MGMLTTPQGQTFYRASVCDKGPQERNDGMDRVDSMRKKYRRGEPVRPSPASWACRTTRSDTSTQDGPLAEPPKARRKKGPRKMGQVGAARGPVARTDFQGRKQARRTGSRRLVDECSADVSEQTVSALRGRRRVSGAAGRCFLDLDGPRGSRRSTSAGRRLS